MTGRSARALAAMLVVAVGRTAPAQPQLTARLEAVRTGRWHAESGVGLTRSLGTYLRADVNVARDVWRQRPVDPSRWRGEAIIRFTLDPLADQPWGLSLGGGLGYRERAYLAATLDLEGPRVWRLRPALAFTAGGGSRLGFVLRQAARNRR